MSHISPVGSFGSSNWLQGLGSTANSSASSGVNAGSGTTITEESLTIVDIDFSSGAPTSSSPSSSSGTSTPSTSNTGTSSSGSSLFANLLNQIDTALQDVLQALGGNTTGASTTSGDTDAASTDATDTGATSTGTTSTGSTSSSGPSNTTPSITTAGTNQTGSAANTQETSIPPSDITITAISIESVEVTTGGASPATTAPTDSNLTTGSNSTGDTNSSNNDLQLLQQVFTALSNVFQQNGLGSSQTSSASSASQSPLATFLGQNGLTPDQFGQGLFSSLQQNGGTGYSLANIFQNAQSGQILNTLA